MILLEYVKRIPGHRNSKGEPAPWTIVSHKTGKILSSHKTKKDAEEHLKQMHIFKEGVGMIKDEKKKSLTDFEKLVDCVERKFGISFYGDLGQADAIGEYKEETGRDLDYLVGSIDDEQGIPIVTITLGHSFGKKGDEDFNYVVGPQNGEPVYEEGISNWKEAAKKAINATENEIKRYNMNGGNKIAKRVAALDKFEDVLVDMESEFRRLKNDLHARYDKKPMDDSAIKPLREFEKKMGELFSAWKEFRFAEKFIRNK